VSAVACPEHLLLHLDVNSSGALSAEAAGPRIGHAGPRQAGAAPRPSQDDLQATRTPSTKGSAMSVDQPKRITPTINNPIAALPAGTAFVAKRTPPQSGASSAAGAGSNASRPKANSRLPLQSPGGKSPVPLATNSPANLGANVAKGPGYTLVAPRSARSPYTPNPRQVSKPELDAERAQLQQVGGQSSSHISRS
jgi:hypothetical protein